MILKRGELVLIRRGRPWFRVPEDPGLRKDQVVRLRSSRRDAGFLITVSGVVEEAGGFRVAFRLGDRTERPRFLMWSGSAGGLESARGYTDDPLLGMWGEPEAVSDWWLRRFAEAAR